METEALAELLPDLKAYRDDLGIEGPAGDGDFRVRLFERHRTLSTGDASYDQDHRGLWGASSVSSEDSDAEVEAALKDAIAQVLQRASQD